MWWVPFDLHPEYPSEGIPRSDRYSREDDQQWKSVIESAGFTYAPAPVVPRSIRALELAQLAGERGRFGDVHRRLFSAYWSEGRDIGDPEMLLAIGTEAGLDPAEVRAALEELPHRPQIEAATSNALELGIRGVPAWVLDQKLFISGAQPPEVFEQAMERLGHQPVEDTP